MGKRIEYEKGHKFEGTRLTYLREGEVVKGKPRKGVFLCECGNETVAVIAGVKNRTTKSCGCLKNESIQQRGRNNKTHGLSKTGAYKSYNAMLRRVYCEDSEEYQNYGGRGITVCERWTDSENGANAFLEDMGERPAGFSLDRIDSDGNYCPENCRWADRGTQSYNRRQVSSNTTGRTGVQERYDTKSDTPTYRVTIGYKGKQIHLLTTKDFDKAVKAREEAELKYYGYIKED